MKYIHHRDEWPDFRWSDAELSGRLVSVRHRQGRLIGRMESMGFSLREEAILQTLTEDVIQSSEIEGEHLDREQVRSSIARRLRRVQVEEPDGSVSGEPGTPRALPSRSQSRIVTPVWRASPAGPRQRNDSA